MGEQTIDDHGNHTRETERDADPLQADEAFTEKPLRHQRREHGVQSGDQRADTGRQAAIDRHEDPTEVQHMHPHACQHDPRDERSLHAWRRSGRRDDGQDRRRKNHADGKECQRTGVVGCISGNDKPVLHNLTRSTAPTRYEKGGPPRRPALQR